MKYIEDFILLTVLSSIILILLTKHFHTIQSYNGNYSLIGLCRTETLCMPEKTLYYHALKCKISFDHVMVGKPEVSH